MLRNAQRGRKLNWSGRDPEFDRYSPAIWLKDASGVKNGVYGSFEANAGFFLNTPDLGYYFPAHDAGPVSLPAWFGFPILPVYNGDLNAIDSYTGIKFTETEYLYVAFEDEKGTVKYGADSTKWVDKKYSELIDDPQYGGPLTYGDEASNYIFHDPITGLTTGMGVPMRRLLGLGVENSFGDAFWSGGAALSNYWSDSYENSGYTDQLTAYNGGYETNNNFLMLYGYMDEPATPVSYDSRPIIAFDAGSDCEVQLQSFDFYYPTYLLHSLMKGDGFNTPATDNTYVNIVVEGFDANHNSTGKVEQKFFTKESFKEMEASSKAYGVNDFWGAIWCKDIPASKYYMINMTVSDDQKGSNGLNTPAYIAIDNVQVKHIRTTYQK